MANRGGPRGGTQHVVQGTYGDVYECPIARGGWSRARPAACLHLVQLIICKLA